MPICGRAVWPPLGGGGGISVNYLFMSLLISVTDELTH